MCLLSEAKPLAPVVRDSVNLCCNDFFFANSNNFSAERKRPETKLQNPVRVTQNTHGKKNFLSPDSARVWTYYRLLATNGAWPRHKRCSKLCQGVRPSKHAFLLWGT